jgi:hypothetical protein
MYTPKHPKLNLDSLMIATIHVMGILSGNALKLGGSRN